MNYRLRHLFLFVVLNIYLSVFKIAFSNTEPAVKRYYMNAEKYLFINTDSSYHNIIKTLNLINLSSDSLLYAQALNIKGLNLSLLGFNNEALAVLFESRQIFEQLNDPIGQTEVALNIGEIYYNWADYNNAFQNFQLALILANDYDLPLYKTKALNYIGKYYHSIGNFEKSIETYNKSLIYAKENYDTTAIIAIQNKIGKHYETLTDYHIALDYYIRSEKMLESTPNLIEKATTYNHLGNIYHLLKEYDKASHFHIQSLHYREQLSYKEGIAKSLNNLGELLIDMELYDSAFNCLQRSYSLCNELLSIKGMVKSIHNQGIINQHKSDMQAAKLNFQEALKLSNEISYDKGILNALYYLALINKKNDDYNKALAYLQKGLTIAEETNIKSFISKFNLLYSELYEEVGEHAKAINYLKAYIKIDKEIANFEKNKQIAVLETRFEVSLKEKENDMLKRENEINALKINRKNTLIFSFSTIVVLLSALIIIILNRSKQKQKTYSELAQLNDKITHQNKELDTLNKDLNAAINQQVKLFSIIAHELRNPLFWFRNLVKMLSDKINSLDKTMIAKSLNSLNESATHTFNLMDNLLQWSKGQLGNIRFSPVKLSLNELIKENIEMIQYLVDFKQINLSLESNEDIIVLADKNMTQTIIRNLLSNALKFTSAHDSITISIRNSNKLALVSISDTGIGMDEKTLKRIMGEPSKNSGSEDDKESGSGLGLILCKEFVDKNGGSMTAKSELNKGSEFSFTLPLFIESES